MKPTQSGQGTLQPGNTGGCELDTDGDGNCPVHPDGCPHPYDDSNSEGDDPYRGCAKCGRFRAEHEEHVEMMVTYDDPEGEHPDLHGDIIDPEAHREAAARFMEEARALTKLHDVDEPMYGGHIDRPGVSREDDDTRDLKPVPIRKTWDEGGGYPRRLFSREPGYAERRSRELVMAMKPQLMPDTQRCDSCAPEWSCFSTASPCHKKSAPARFAEIMPSRPSVGWEAVRQPNGSWWVVHGTHSMEVVVFERGLSANGWSAEMLARNEAAARNRQPLPFDPETVVLKLPLAPAPTAKQQRAIPIPTLDDLMFVPMDAVERSQAEERRTSFDHLTEALEHGTVRIPEVKYAAMSYKDKYTTLRREIVTMPIGGTACLMLAEVLARLDASPNLPEVVRPDPADLIDERRVPRRDPLPRATIHMEHTKRQGRCHICGAGPDEGCDAGLHS